jgi:hypothetical protein
VDDVAGDVEVDVEVSEIGAGQVSALVRLTRTTTPELPRRARGFRTHATRTTVRSG